MISNIRNAFCAYEERKVFKGNYISINGKFMAPFNELSQRIKMREKGHVTANRILTEYNQCWFVKKGTTRFYLKEVDRIVDGIDYSLYDSNSQIDESDEIIWALKDKLFSMNEELKRLKGLCSERGISLD